VVGRANVPAVRVTAPLVEVVVADVKVVVPNVFMMLGKTWATAPVVIAPPALVRAPPASKVRALVNVSVAPVLTITLAAAAAAAVVTVAELHTVTASPERGATPTATVAEQSDAFQVAVVAQFPVADEKRAAAITCPLATSSKRARTKEEKRDIIRTSGKVRKRDCFIVNR